MADNISTLADAIQLLLYSSYFFTEIPFFLLNFKEKEIFL